MYTFIIALTVLVSILLIIVVLVQKSKGGGLASSFAGSNQIMGVRRTNDFIEKATWTLAAVIGILAVVSVFVMPRNLVQSGSRVKPVEEIPAMQGTEYQTPVAAPTATEAIDGGANAEEAAEAAPAAVAEGQAAADAVAGE